MGGPTCSPLRWIPMAVRSRKRGVQALFLSGRFGNSTGSAGPDILVEPPVEVSASRNVFVASPLSF
jgi:hypothetical protein